MTFAVACPISLKRTRRTATKILWRVSSVGSVDADEHFCHWASPFTSLSYIYWRFSKTDCCCALPPSVGKSRLPRGRRLLINRCGFGQEVRMARDQGRIFWNKVRNASRICVSSLPVFPNDLLCIVPFLEKPFQCSCIVPIWEITFDCALWGKLQLCIVPILEKPFHCSLWEKLQFFGRKNAKNCKKRPKL